VQLKVELAGLDRSIVLPYKVDKTRRKFWKITEQMLQKF
jgi:hypothetical protein